MNTKFSTLTIGARFTFCDETFTKIAHHLAADAEGLQHLFDDETEVELLTVSPPANEPALGPH